MDKIKNIDFSTALVMLLLVACDVIAELAANEELLAVAPPWLFPLALAVAASARYRFGQTPANDKDGGA